MKTVARIAVLFLCLLSLAAIAQKAKAEPQYTDSLVGAIDMNEIRKAKELIKRGVPKEDYIDGLLMASMRGRKDLIALILERKIDINSISTRFGQAALHQTEITGDLVTAEFLIQRGADINAQDSNGQTILMGAAFQGNKQMVDMLLSRRANVTLKDKQGRTALTYAKTGARPGIIVPILVSAGAKD